MLATFIVWTHGMMRNRCQPQSYWVGQGRNWVAEGRNPNPKSG